MGEAKGFSPSRLFSIYNFSGHSSSVKSRNILGVTPEKQNWSDDF